jgi:hypothetical protein
VSVTEELRRAVSAGLYPKAQALLIEYRRLLESLPAGEREGALKEAAEITEWARRTTLAGRAAAAARLGSLAAPPAHYRAEAPPWHTWEVLG